jgi:hypothetical protein
LSALLVGIVKVGYAILAVTYRIQLAAWGHAIFADMEVTLAGEYKVIKIGGKDF